MCLSPPLQRSRIDAPSIQLASAPLKCLTEVAICHHNLYNTASFEPYHRLAAVPLNRLLLSLEPFSMFSDQAPAFPSIGWDTLHHLNICSQVDIRQQVWRLTLAQNLPLWLIYLFSRSHFFTLSSNLYAVR